MDESIHRKWGIWIQAVSLFAIAVSGVFAFVRYFDTTQREFQQPLWNQQVSVYFEASRVAAQLANAERREDRDELADRFWELYRGPMCIIEDVRVEEAMVQFGAALVDLQNFERAVDELSRKKLEPDPRTSMKGRIREAHAKLSSLSLRLAWACRDSLNETMDAGLPALKFRKNETR